MRRRFGSANAVSVAFMPRIYPYRNMPVKAYFVPAKAASRAVAPVLSLAAGYAGPPLMARGPIGPAGRRCSLEDRRARPTRVLVSPTHLGVLAGSGRKDGRDTKSTRRWVSSQ